jgi:phage terminase Nu1 subunit (DNA packaging protein)
MASARGKAKRRRHSRRTKRATGLSYRAFAKIVGVDEKAVRKGVTSGRLEGCVGRSNGRPYIMDPDLARQKWAAGATKPAPNGSGAPTLTQVQIRVAEERAAALRLSNEQRSGRLIFAEEARREAFECARAVRDGLLNLPDRLAGELAAESDARRVHARLDDELRKALETMAEVLAHGE